MLKFRFSHRVATYRGGAVLYKSPAAAGHLVDSGLAVVRKKVAKTITEIELTDLAIGYRQGQAAVDRLGLRPGSFGIREETFPSGIFCYSHRNHWPCVLCATGATGSE